MFVVLAKYPDSEKWHVSGVTFTSRIAAMEHIRKQLSYKSLASSTATYKLVPIFNCQDFNEDTIDA